MPSINSVNTFDCLESLIGFDFVYVPTVDYVIAENLRLIMEIPTKREKRINRLLKICELGSKYYPTNKSYRETTSTLQLLKEFYSDNTSVQSSATNSVEDCVRLRAYSSPNQVTEFTPKVASSFRESLSAARRQIESELTNAVNTNSAAFEQSCLYLTKVCAALSENQLLKPLLGSCIRIIFKGSQSHKRALINAFPQATLEILEIFNSAGDNDIGISIDADLIAETLKTVGIERVAGKCYENIFDAVYSTVHNVLQTLSEEDPDVDILPTGQVNINGTRVMFASTVDLSREISRADNEDKLISRYGDKFSKMICTSNKSIQFCNTDPSKSCIQALIDGDSICNFGLVRLRVPYWVIVNHQFGAHRTRLSGEFLDIAISHHDDPQVTENKELFKPVGGSPALYIKLTNNNFPICIPQSYTLL